MSQSMNLSVTDSAEASQPELEASGDQCILLSDLSPPPPATGETPSAPEKETIEEGHIFGFRTWISENKMAAAGWVVALLSLIITAVSMLPSFRSESISQRALELAEWTALKEFIENCRQDHQVGLASVACQAAITQSLPPPPHVQITSSIIKRWTDNGGDCKKRDKSLSLSMAIKNIIILSTYIVLAALYVAMLRIRHMRFSTRDCIEKNWSQVENSAEQISKIFRYETIDFDAYEPLDAQVAEVRSKHRFEGVSRAGLALSDRKGGLKRGQYDTMPWPDEIASFHASTLMYVDEAAISGLIRLVATSLSMALGMCAAMII